MEDLVEDLAPPMPDLLRLSDDTLNLVFEFLESRHLAFFVMTGCQALRQRLFAGIRTLKIQLDPQNRVLWPEPFIRSFGSLTTFGIGNPRSNEGPYVPGLDLAALPRSLTTLELYVANGLLALLSLPSLDLQQCLNDATLLPLHTMFPQLTRLHFHSNYIEHQELFPGLQICRDLAQLELFSLTLSPLHLRMSELSELPDSLRILKIRCSHWMSRRVASIAPQDSELILPIHHLPQPNGSLEEPAKPISRSESRQPKHRLPPELRELELSYLCSFSLLDLPEFPTHLQRLKLDFDDDKAKTAFGLKLDFSILPPSLLSFYLRFLSYSLPVSNLKHLPETLDELRLYVLQVNEDTELDFYSSVPRSLRTLHLFCVDESPLRGSSYDNLPRGLVDLCCDRLFSFRGLPVVHKPQIRPKEILLAIVPPDLMRSRSTPPENDCSPDELLSLLPHPSLTDIDFVVDLPPNMMQDMVKNVRRLRYYNYMGHIGDASSLPLFPTLESFTSNRRTPVFLLKQLQRAQGQSTASSAPETATPRNSMLPPLEPLPSITTLDSGANYADFTADNDWKETLDETLFPNLRSITVDIGDPFLLPTAFPSCLTELNLLSPPVYPIEEVHSSIIAAAQAFRPLLIYPLLPPTLRKLRTAIAMFHETESIFALLPPMLEELYLHGVDIELSPVEKRRIAWMREERRKAPEDTVEELQSPRKSKKKPKGPKGPKPPKPPKAPKPPKGKKPKKPFEPAIAAQEQAFDIEPLVLNFDDLPPFSILPSQLHYLPPSITKIMIPLTGTREGTNPGDELLVEGDEATDSLMRFFSERPQLVSFTVWKRAMGNEFIQALPNRNPNGQPPNWISPSRTHLEFLYTTLSTRNTTSLWALQYMPSVSLRRAVGDTTERRRVELASPRPNSSINLLASSAPNGDDAIVSSSAPPITPENEDLPPEPPKEIRKLGFWARLFGSKKSSPKPEKKVKTPKSSPKPSPKSRESKISIVLEPVVDHYLISDRAKSPSEIVRASTLQWARNSAAILQTAINAEYIASAPFFELPIEQRTCADPHAME